jgi:predicted nucleic acid-binding protein
LTPTYLLDTNILLRLVDRVSTYHSAALLAVMRLLSAGYEVYITAQNLIEFWSVVTRPLTANGFGWDVTRAHSEVDALRDRFPLIEDTPDIFVRWLQLVVAVGVNGRQVHDARLVAVMEAHAITHLLSFNVDDFRRYRSITVIHPNDIH